MSREQARQWIEPLADLAQEPGDYTFIGNAETLAEATLYLLVIHQRHDGRYDIYRAFSPEDHPDGAPADHLAYEGLSAAEAAVVIGARVRLHHHTDWQGPSQETGPRRR